jgi:hypothetical protein
MRTGLTVFSFLLSMFSATYSQNVGIGTTNPLDRLSVGSSSQFRVDANGNIVRINNLPYSFPSAQGANQYLRNDGSGNLTWTPAPKPVIRVFTCSPNGGFSAWLIDNPADYVSANNADPTLVLQRGFTYQFIINGGGNHPFVITNTAGAGTFSVGVTNNGTADGTITFTVPMDAPATLFYYCSAHAAMNGTLTIQ